MRDSTNVHILKSMVDNKNYRILSLIGIIVLGILAIVVLYTYILQDQEEVEPSMTVGSLMANPIYDKEVRISGWVDKLGEFSCPCFELTTGGAKVQVWYGSMINDDGTQRPAVSVENLQNGDEVIVTGVLKMQGPHTSDNDFWASKVEIKEPAQESSLANPASVYCEEQGGEYVGIERETGTRGYCKLPDGRVCAQWRYFYSKGEECEELD